MRKFEKGKQQKKKKKKVISSPGCKQYWKPLSIEIKKVKEKNK